MPLIAVQQRVQQLPTLPERTTKPCQQRVIIVLVAGKRIGRRIKSNSDAMGEQRRDADESTDDKTDIKHSLLIYIYS